jgi:hypothetical protein
MAKERHGRLEQPREFTADAERLYAVAEGQWTDHLARVKSGKRKSGKPRKTQTNTNLHEPKHSTLNFQRRDGAEADTELVKPGKGR